MNLDDTSRINLIENICGNSELKMRYAQHKTKMGELEISMKLLNEHKKEFFSEKKQEKLRIENSKKIKKTTNEFEKTFEQFSLMILYHNEKKINETIPEELNALIGNLDEKINEYKINYSKYNESLKTKIEIEKDVSNSETDLTKLLFDLIACKKNLINYNDELESIDNQKKFADIVNQEYFVRKAQFDLRFTQLQKLECAYTKFSNSITEYSELRNEFIESNYDFILYISAKRKIDQLQSCKNKAMENKLLVDCLCNENAMFKEQVKVLENNEKELAKSLNTLNVRLNKLNSELSIMEKIVKEGKKAITDKLMDNSSNLNDIKRIEQRLRDKFSSSIIGILSDLFDVKESNGITVTKSQILSCLGKYSNAIVVENQAILKEISMFLRMQQNDQISIILMPEKYYKPTSPINLMNKSVPNVKLASIESFLDPASDEIMTILMHILKPTVVCDSKKFDAVYKVFNYFGKSVKVTSFVVSVTCAPKKFISTHSTIINVENIVDTAINVTESRIKAVDLKCNLQVENHAFLLSLGRLINLKIMIKFMKEGMARNTKFIDALNKKTDKLEELANLLNNDSYDKVVESFEELRAKFQPLINEHYRDFCQKHQIQNFEEYESLVPKLIHFSSIQKALQDSNNIINDQIKHLSELRTDKDFYDNRKAELEIIIEKAKLEQENASEQLEKAKVNCEQTYAKWINKMTEIVAEKGKYAEMNENLKTMLLNICSGMNEKRMLLSENYKLLYQIFSNFENLSTVNGSLMSQLIFNDETNESFDLIQHHLEQ